MATTYKTIKVRVAVSGHKNKKELDYALRCAKRDEGLKSWAWYGTDHPTNEDLSYKIMGVERKK